MATPTPLSIIITSLALLLPLPHAVPLPLMLSKCGVDFYGDLGIGFLNDFPDISQLPPTRAAQDTSTVAPNKGEHVEPTHLVREQHETNAIAPNIAGSRIVTFSSRQQIYQVATADFESTASIKVTLQDREAQLKAQTAELAEAHKEMALTTDRAKGLASKVSTLEIEKKNLQDKSAALDRKTAELEKNIASLKVASAALTAAKEASDAKFVKLEQETKQKIAGEGLKWKQHYLKIAAEDWNRLSGEDSKLRGELIGSVKFQVIQEYRASVVYRKDVEVEISRYKQSPEYVKEVQGKIREAAFLSLRGTVNEHKARKTDLPLHEWKCYQPYFAWEDELKRQGSNLALKEPANLQPKKEA